MAHHIERNFADTVILCCNISSGSLKVIPRFGYVTEDMKAEAREFLGAALLLLKTKRYGNS